MEQLTIDQFTVFCENREEVLRIRQEIFTHHAYYFETESEKPVIIDAGAHIGLATLYFKKLYPTAQIIAIEPHPDSCKLLRKNIEVNYLEDVTVIEAALAADARMSEISHDGKLALADLPRFSTTTRTFHADTQFNWFSTASFQAGAWNKAQTTDSFSVPTLSLSKVLQTIGKQIDLLKLDIEGAEQEVITEALNNLAQVAHIICEYHPMATQNRENFIKLLEKQHYDVTHEDKTERFHGPRELELIEAVRS